MSEEGFASSYSAKADVGVALKVFHADENVRLKLVEHKKERTPSTEHQLHSALAAAGVGDRLVRERMICLMLKSAHFEEISS